MLCSVLGVLIIRGLSSCRPPLSDIARFLRVWFYLRLNWFTLHCGVLITRLLGGFIVALGFCCVCVCVCVCGVSVLMCGYASFVFPLQSQCFDHPPACGILFHPVSCRCCCVCFLCACLYTCFCHVVWRLLVVLSFPLFVSLLLYLAYRVSVVVVQLGRRLCSFSALSLRR